MFYRICAAGTSEFGNRDIFGHFFPKCQICKSAKKTQKTQKKCPENTWNFGVFIENRLWRFVEALKKCRKWHRNPRAHLHTFFPKFREGHFRGFRDFQLRIEVKFRKKAFFDVFWKKFSLFAFYRWRSTAPFFTWGENLNLLFFEKCGTRFRFWVRFVLLLLRKSVRTKMTTPTDYPIGPLLRSQFSLRFFVQIPGCEMASKTVLQYYYIGYESREESM
jgi:hypothetical protein